MKQIGILMALLVSVSSSAALIFEENEFDFNDEFISEIDALNSSAEPLVLECKAYPWGGTESYESCKACQAQHRQCRLRCFEDYFVARAEGIDSHGRYRVFEGRSNQREVAERRAMDQCQLEASSCYISDVWHTKRLKKSEPCQQD